MDVSHFVYTTMYSMDMWTVEHMTDLMSGIKIYNTINNLPGTYLTRFWPSYFKLPVA